jgi:hypothetical protein
MDYSLRAILVRGRSVETIQGWMIVRFVLNILTPCQLMIIGLLKFRSTFGKHLAITEPGCMLGWYVSNHIRH